MPILVDSNTSPLFLSINILVMISSTPLQHAHFFQSLGIAKLEDAEPILISGRNEPESPFSVFLLCALSFNHSPPTWHRDQLCEILLFHVHFLEKVNPLAGIQVIILVVSQNDFSTLSQAARYI